MTALLSSKRIHSNPMSSIAVWSGPGINFPLYCLEPGVSRIPHPRIPAGIYPLRLRTIGQKHLIYKSRYDAIARFGPDWHQGMIEICDVPDRTAIEFHVGNFIKDTQGCSLTGLSYDQGADGNYRVISSRVAYERVYPIIRDLIWAGPTHVQISDIGAMA